MEDEFEKSLECMRRKSTPTSDDDLLLLYGLYKQIREGNCMIPPPWHFQALAYARWESWHNNWDMPRNMAMKKYIEKVNELMKS
jgi:diazepam-binding inhibitor (GABA receptor modulator, acyl-CoA-binding protein)